ncbi:hypothetical protein J3E68DRAFT_406443 [Trichoderma sp. SZMC 28012]
MIRSLQFAVQLDHWTFGSRLDARPQASSHPLLTNFLFGDIVCAVLGLIWSSESSTSKRERIRDAASKLRLCPALPGSVRPGLPLVCFVPVQVKCYFRRGCHDYNHDHDHDPSRLLTTFNFSPDGVVGCHFDGLSLDLALKQAWSSVPATTLDPRARSRANPLSQLSVLLCDRRTWPGCRDPWLNASGRPLSLLLAPVPQVLGGTAGCILGVGAL